MSTQLALFAPAQGAEFELGEREVPKPGPNDILVKIEAAALNPADWKIAAYGVHSPQWPVILGFDAAGIVAEIGADVTKFTKGDKV